MGLGFHDLMDEQQSPRTPSLAHLRKRSRWRLAAISGATFLALLGFETARLHNGHDPALARSSTRATSTQTSTQSQSDSGSSSGQSYYTPPSYDPPVTSSS